MITEFQGEYRFLSNFWPAVVELDGFKYPTVEHAYQAAKTLDVDVREAIRSAATPGVAKRAGQSAEVRTDWESVKIEVMYALLKQKFQRPDLRKKLLNTRDYMLIEGNTWGDRFWGVCKGTGENNLGKLLMQVRRELNSAEMS